MRACGDSLNGMLISVAGEECPPALWAGGSVLCMWVIFLHGREEFLFTRKKYPPEFFRKALIPNRKVHNRTRRTNTKNSGSFNP